MAAIGPDAVLTPAQTAFISTLDEPNTVSIEASEQRINAAHAVGILPAAIDAAVSARA